MKLGDSMAPIEACSSWNDVCSRKARPPKIGDIPRHVAVDQESPGCSTSRSLGQYHDVKSSISMLERSTSCHSEHGKSKGSVTLPVIEKFLNTSESTRNNEKLSRIPRKLELKLNETIEDSYNSISFDDKNINGTLPIFKKITTTSGLADKEPEVLKKYPNIQSSKFTLEKEIDVLWEDESPEGIFEVRKDSALYLEEKNIDSSSLVEFPRTIVAPSSLSIRENVEETGNSRLSGRKARRESSGYFSNLGTFDEDRWSTNFMDHSSQQDNTTRETIRERRRSSTKNRLPTSNHQQINQSPICLAGGQQSNKMTSLVCPSTSIEQEITQYSSANEFPSASTKMGRIEMPNIDEQTSLELDKSINNELEENDERNDLIDDDLRYKISQVSLGSSPMRDDISSLRFRDSSSYDEKTNVTISKDNIVTTDSPKKFCNIVDSGNQWSPRTSRGQRRRIVQHQYSSPNITNSELTRIVEKPHSESLLRINVESQFDVEKNVKREEESDIENDEEDDDDDDQVITARLNEAKTSRDNESDARKLLPKSIKVYQLLSTQSEDRGDDDPRLFDRRISLQITRQEDETIRENVWDSQPIERVSVSSDYVEDKKLLHADSVPILKIPSSIVTSEENREGKNFKEDSSKITRKLSSTGELLLCTGERFIDNPTGPAIAGIRPIYPYCPYSPYASPQGSPRTNRRRPLRESRRVSIDSRQGALQLNQYKLLKDIGQGSYGIVKLAYNEEDETHYAMKILSKKKLMKKAGIFGRIAPGRKGVSSPLAKVYREIALLKKLDHPNVVKLVEVLDDPDEDNLYLVFELVQRGEVLQLPTDKPLDEETARRHFRDVVMGVEYLHYQRIVHRDIKPSNLLVDSEGRVKVADLGVSAELRTADELLSGSAGTPAFAAPETTTPGAQYSGTLCDVWSMGVTLYSLVTGKVPWDGAGSIIGVQSAVRSEQLRFPEKPILSENLCDLVSRMLMKDPLKRITLTEIKEHCWLTKNGDEPLPNEADNCRLPVTVTDEEVARVVTRVPKLDTLILIKTMLKQHSFQNPFLSRRTTRSTGDKGTSSSCLKQQASSDTTDSSKESLTTVETITSKTEQFHKAGRSNSAPDSYEWQTNGRQISSDSLLPPVTESSSQEAEVEKR